jgi:hypothetical protein
LRAFDRRYRQTRIARDDERRQLLEEQTQTRLALPQLPLHEHAGAAQVGVAQRALDGWAEALQVVLEDVVVGAHSNGLDRGFLADGAADDQAWNVGAELFDELEHRDRAKGRHRIVAQDQVPLLREGNLCVVAPVDALRDEIESVALQRQNVELGIVGRVVYAQHP